MKIKIFNYTIKITKNKKWYQRKKYKSKVIIITRKTKIISQKRKKLYYFLERLRLKYQLNY